MAKRVEVFSKFQADQRKFDELTGEPGVKMGKPVTAKKLLNVLIAGLVVK